MQLIKQTFPTVALALGVTQTIAWASSYYLPAMLAVHMARDLGVEPSTVFAGFTLALLVSAPMGPLSGHLIDKFGGRIVLSATSLGFALGLWGLSQAQNVWTHFLAWGIMGVAMGFGLYEAAFATLTRVMGTEARPAIAGVTLLGGLASTLSWPLSAWMESQWGWRQACLGWACLHLLVGLPLNALWRARRTTALSASLNEVDTKPTPEAGPVGSNVNLKTTGFLLATAFATSYFASVAMASHLPRLLQACGVTLVAAVLVGSLIGPAQVLGRLLEVVCLKGQHPIWSARLATLGHPLGVLALLTIGPAAAPFFAIVHGIGNGVMTIARGTLPLALFGPVGYGARQGWLVMPSRILSALAPYLTGLALDAWGNHTWWLTLGLSSLAALALIMVKLPTDCQAEPTGRPADP